LCFQKTKGEGRFVKNKLSEFLYVLSNFFYFVAGTGYFEMWCCRRMEKIRWTDRVRNEEVLKRVKEERNHTAIRIVLVISHVETAL
jgi:hypothetical protein